MPAIKMFVTIRRRPPLSAQQFHDHWRHPHGTWGRGIAHLVSYVQSHRLDTPHLGAGQHEVDGVVEVGFENAQDVGAMPQDPVYLHQLKPDEPTFVENTGLGFMEEDVLQSAPAPSDGRWPWREIEQPVSIKLIQLLRGTVSAQWRQKDDLTLGQAIGALRHACATCHPALHADPGSETITALRQLWWPTYSAFEEGIAQDRAAWRELAGRMDAGYSGLFQAERFI